MLAVFDIMNTPLMIKDQVGYKYEKMRNLGTNQWSSVTCAIIEELLQYQQAKSLSYLIPQSTQVTTELTKDLITLLEQLTQPHMTLQYFYDQLRIIDASNLLLGNYVTDQLKSRFNYPIRIGLDQNSMTNFIRQFDATLYIVRHDGTNSTVNSKGSIPVMIYKSKEGYYYYFPYNRSTSSRAQMPAKQPCINLLRERNIAPQELFKQPQQPKTQETSKCNFCFRQHKLGVIFINQCGHQICMTCADKAISKSLSMIKCCSGSCQPIDCQELLKYFYETNKEENQQRCIIFADNLTNRSYKTIQQDKLRASIQRQIDMIQQIKRPENEDSQVINNHLNDHNPIQKIQLQAQIDEQVFDQPQKIQFSRCPKCGQLINKDNLKFALNHKNGYSIQFCCATDEEIQQIIANQESQIIDQYKD